MTLKYEIERTDNCLLFYRHKRFHRMQNPSIIVEDKPDRSYHEYGELHRLSGPAQIFHPIYFHYHRGYRVPKI